MSRDPQPTDYLEVRVLWADDTAYGTTLSGRLERTVRERLHPRTYGLLAAEMLRAPELRRRFTPAEAAALVREERRRLRHRRIVQDEAFWRPQADLCRPAALVVTAADGAQTLSLPASAADCAALREVFSGRAPPPTPLDRLLDRTHSALAADGWARPRIETTDPIFVGHACVSLSDGAMRLWTDPFLRPKRRRHPACARPLSPLDFPEQRHVVLISHAHPDHFDPGSLFLFPPDTTVVVPQIDAETPLALDLSLRLRQLGLTDVVELGWGRSLQAAGFTITAHPFHGEQPLGPGAASARADRNAGNVYHVADAAGRTFLFLADAGGDAGAAVDIWSRDLRRAVGPVDVLFANHRTWRLYPPQYLTTSVPQFLAYAPDEELELPQQIMLSVQDLRTVAGVLGARRVAPYAMGGTPWFAELGLGYDHAAGAGPTAFDTPAVDSLAADDADGLIEAEGRSVLVEAGQSLPVDGAPRWPCGVGFADPAAFSAAPPPPAARALALGACSPEALADLLQITRLDPSAFLIATPTFAEIVCDGGDEAAALFEAAERLAPEAAWRFRAADPLTPGAFGADPVWSQLFCDLHRELGGVLRDRGDLAAALRAALRRAPLDAAPPALVGAIIEDLLGLLSPIENRDEAPLTLAAPALALPPSAQAHVEAWGAVRTGLALLAVKTAHNLYVTASATAGVDEPEAAWLARAFGPQA